LILFFMFYTYINYDFLHLLLWLRMYTCYGPDVCQQGARTFWLKIFIRNIIILCIWAQASIENTKTKKPAHQKSHSLCECTKFFYNWCSLFSDGGYITNYQFCIQKGQSEVIQVCMLTSLPCPPLRLQGMRSVFVTGVTFIKTSRSEMQKNCDWWSMQSWLHETLPHPQETMYSFF